MMTDINENLIVKDPTRADVYIHKGVYYVLQPGSYDPQDKLTIRAALEDLIQSQQAAGPLSLEARRNNMLTVLSQQAEQVLHASVTLSTVPGHTFSASERAWQNAVSAALTIRSELPGTPEEIFWDTAEGSVTIITALEVLELHAVMGYLRNATYQRWRALETAIKASDAPETVALLEGWPPIPFDIG